MDSAVVGSLDEELSDDIRRRVKSELEPGERLLWAGSPCDRPVRLSGRVLTLAAILLVPTVPSVVRFLENPLGPIGGLLFLGLAAGFVDFVIILGIVIHLLSGRVERDRRASTLYALTDRRAILWTPDPSGALKIVTIRRGSVQGVHRLEFPDGSGDVVFRVKDGHYDGQSWGQTGFRGIADVRRVEEQVRRTLVTPPATSAEG